VNANDGDARLFGAEFWLVLGGMIGRLKEQGGLARQHFTTVFGNVSAA